MRSDTFQISYHPADLVPRRQIVAGICIEHLLYTLRHFLHIQLMLLVHPVQVFYMHARQAPVRLGPYDQSLLYGIVVLHGIFDEDLADLTFTFECSLYL